MNFSRHINRAIIFTTIATITTVRCNTNNNIYSRVVPGSRGIPARVLMHTLCVIICFCDSLRRANPAHDFVIPTTCAVTSSGRVPFAPDTNYLHASVYVREFTAVACRRGCVHRCRLKLLHFGRQHDGRSYFFSVRLKATT